MDLSLPAITGVCALIFIVSLLYSSVGHGGASGYLAVLSFISVSPAVMSTTALVLNVVVSATALVMFARAGYLSGRLAAPFLVSSVPAAFIGGMLRFPSPAYSIILAVVLLYAAVRLILPPPRGTSRIPATAPRLSIALPGGAAIGAVSGIVGVGGAIFLSPLILLKNWAQAKQTAAVSALFVLVNSLAGLGGRVYAGTFELLSLVPFLVAALVGGLIGSRLGSGSFSNLTIRRILGMILLVAAVKLFFVHAGS